MNILSFTGIVVFTASLLEGLYIISNDARSGANRLFLAISLSIAVWLLGASFGYSAGNRDQVVFWVKLCSPGFIFLHAFILHFVSRYTGLLGNRLICLAYIPSFVFLYISVSDHLVFANFYREGRYWIAVPDYFSTAFYCLMANYLSYYAVSLAMLYLNMRKTSSRRVRAQSRIIFFSILATILSYNIEPFLVPLFFGNKTYAISPIFSVIWLTGIWYAMARYRFLRINIDYFQGAILGALNDMVLVADPEKRILIMNKSMSARLNIGASPAGLEDIIVEKEILDRQIGVLAEDETAHILLNFRTSAESTALMRVSLSVFSDKFGDRVGYLFVAHEVSDALAAAKRKKITDRELEVIKLVLAGNGNREIAEALDITLKTVETHITSVFNKLGLKNRIELAGHFLGENQPG
ncbi:MAG: hypothetical protein EPN93_00700 [Spirochaetes bacterium]|nr:MAG: hypothetical protein EPN93_00700 [Spirochaetota bacterium]